MNNKVKGALVILLMSVSFYMMVTTKYTRALGDYILEFIGLKSWMGDYSGAHLTVIYFGILFVIGLYLVERLVINNLNIRRRNVFLIFIISMVMFYLLTGLTVRTMKKYSSGLFAIGYNSFGSMNYRFEDNKLVDFTASFKLTNYSNEKKTFKLSIDSSFYRKEGIEEISFYTFDGKKAIFELESNETKSFSLNSDNYNVVGGMGFENGFGSGSIYEIVLTNDKGNKITLERNNGFVIELGR